MSFLVLFVIFTLIAMIGGRFVTMMLSMMLGTGIVLICWLAGPWFGFPKFAFPYEAPTLFWSIWFVSTGVFYFGLYPLLNEKV